MTVSIAASAVIMTPGLVIGAVLCLCIAIASRGGDR